jgi:hypothetical protein
MARTLNSPNFEHRQLLSPFTPQALQENKVFIRLKREVDLGLAAAQGFSPIHKNLQALLTEVAFTINPKIQEMLLRRVQKWYESKTANDVQLKNTAEKKNFVIITEQIPTKIQDSPKKIEIYVPKSLKVEKKHNEQSIRKESVDGSIKQATTRASSSEPINRNYNRRNSQSPGLIRSIVNNFVKNKRGIMYNFMLNEFLEEVKKNPSETQPEAKKPRPLSTSAAKQYQEVHNIKSRLARKRIICGVKSLSDALVIQDSLEDSLSSLPAGGEWLLKADKSP